MNFNFDNSKRRVRLGGKSANAESREEVLRRTHAQREQRARERLEQKSALRIQSFWRSRSAAGKGRQQLRQKWVEEYGERGEHLDRVASAAAADAALRELLFFCRPSLKGDVTRLAAVGHAIFRVGSTQGPPAMVIAATQGDRLQAFTQTLRLSRLVTLCIECLTLHRQWILPETSAQQEEADLRSLGKMLLYTAVRAIDPKMWQLAGSCGPAQLAKLMRMLGSRGLFHSLSNLLLTASVALESSQNQTSARGGVASTSAPSAVLTAAAEPAQVGGPTAGAVAALTKQYLSSSGMSNGGGTLVLSQLLCTPFLWSRNSELRASAGRIWLHVTQELGAENGFLDLLPTDIANGKAGSAVALLGNLAEAATLASQDTRLLGTTSQEVLLSSAMSFAAVSARLLQYIPVHSLFPMQDIESEDLETTGLTPDTATGTPATAWNEREMSLSRAAGQLKLLVSSTALRLLLNILLPQNAAPMRMPASRRVWALCRMLSVPLGLPAWQHETRLALAVNPDLVTRCWDGYLKASFLSGNWESPHENEAADPGYMLPLVLISHCFSTFLAVSAEDNFYEQQRPLAFSELYREDGKGLLGLLKYALWQVLWVEQTRGRSSTKAAAQALRDSVSSAVGRLLGQLFDRNCRRRFAPPEAFYAAHLSADLFNTEVMQSLRRGAFLEAKNTRVWLVLRHAPFLVPFQVRAAVFQSVVRADKLWQQEHERHHLKPSHPITIRRDQLFWDGFEQMNGLGEQLKARLQITFIDVHGIQEAGIDGGGLFKEFMEGLVKEGFNPQLGLFLATEDNRLYPNPNASLAMEQAIPAFEFLGRMVGKAIYEGIIVELPLASFFLKQLLQRGADVNDLSSLDAELYRNLMLLRSYEGDVEDLALTFTITQDVYGDNQERELVPGGRNRPVTNANKTEYILRTANFRLNVMTRRFTDAFRQGLVAVIEPEWVSMFNEEEFQMLIRGRGSAGVDVDDLQQNAHYAGGYHADHPTIKAFWQTLANFTPQQQADWLKFVTACSRAPLLGFSHLYPQLCISKAGQENNPEAVDRLPTSATCMNLLKLPPYRSQQQLAQKLLFAIQNNAGFDLS